MVRCEDWLPSPRTQAKEKSEDPKGDQSRVFIGKTGAEAETPVLQTPDVKS